MTPQKHPEMLKITYQVKIFGCFACFIKYNV